MNLTESLAFDTEAARIAVEKEEAIYGNCDTVYPMLAYEIIDLLKIELTRLHALETAKLEAALNEICNLYV